MNESDPVIVVPYDPAWASAFQHEKARLDRVLGARALGIEHIGSTAVPGLAAKPVIDFLVGMASMEAADAAIPLLEADGWIFPPDMNERIGDRRYLKRVKDGVRTHHLHLVVYDAPMWREYLFFRDKLRAHPELRVRYEELKRELASKYREERPTYTSSKTSFVKEVLGLPPDSHPIARH